MNYQYHTVTTVEIFEDEVGNPASEQYKAFVEEYPLLELLFVVKGNKGELIVTYKHTKKLPIGVSTNGR